MIDNKELDNNPIIVNVEEVEDLDVWHDKITITLVGVSKKLASIECEAGSGSGWYYGASVSITCKSLNLDEIIVEY